MKKMISARKAMALCVLTMCVTIAGASCGFVLYFNWRMPDYMANSEVYGKIAEIRETVDRLYVGEYDVQDAVDTAAAGFMSGVGDRWSSYMSAEEYSAYQLSFAGESTGIGVYGSYSAVENSFRIIEVYTDSTALNYDVVRGDYILAADGITLADDGYTAMMEAIAGEEGTAVDITFLRDQTGEEFTATLTRKTTTQTMVHGEMLDDEIGYIYIYNFHQQVEDQFAQVVEDLIAQGAQKFVFDVRNNPGGSVTSLCEILDSLVPEGRIMSLCEKDGDETIYDSDADYLDMPMAVLVNASSISAAELFAAVLQEYDVAEIIGEQTIGKGYAQRLYELSDGSAINLSDQAYFTSQGISLIDIGVVPDIQVVFESDSTQSFHFLSVEQDNQLKMAVEYLTNLG